MICFWTKNILGVFWFIFGTNLGIKIEAYYLYIGKYGKFANLSSIKRVSEILKFCRFFLDLNQKKLGWLRFVKFHGFQHLMTFVDFFSLTYIDIFWLEYIHFANLFHVYRQKNHQNAQFSYFLNFQWYISLILDLSINPQTFLLFPIFWLLSGIYGAADQAFRLMEIGATLQKEILLRFLNAPKVWIRWYGL